MLQENHDRHIFSLLISLPVQSYDRLVLGLSQQCDRNISERQVYKKANKGRRY
jgi:hypothetical protein